MGKGPLTSVRLFNCNSQLFGAFDFGYFQNTYGITSEKAYKSDYQAPLLEHADLFLRNANDLNDPCFGLTWVNETQYNIADHILRKLGSAPDVATFLQQSARFSSLISEHGVLSLEPYNQENYILKFIPEAVPEINYHQTDAVLLIAKRMANFLPKYRYPDAQVKRKNYSCVLLTHQKPLSSGSKYEQNFKIPVLFSQKVNGLLVPKSWLNLRLAPIELPITNIVAYEVALAKMNGKQSHAEIVAQCIIALLPYGSPKREEIAKALNMSLRSFQRRLSEENSSFKALLDDVRKQQTSCYLDRNCYSLEEVAFLLGYSSVTAFYAAFKRWHNTTPRQLHAQVLSKNFNP